MTTRKEQRAFREKIAQYILDGHQEDTYREISLVFNCTEPTVGAIARKLLGFRRQSTIKPAKALAAAVQLPREHDTK
jgi:hypothetical protein